MALPNSTSGEPGLIVLPSYDVAIIGAGISGLQAAQVLKERAPALRVVVLGASKSIGGRVKHIDGVAPWPIELGAQFLHGKSSSSIKSIVDAMGCHQREYPFPDRVFFGREGTLLTHDEEHPDLELCHELFAGVSDEDGLVGEESMADYLLRKGANHNVMELGQAIYANDFGCSLHQLGLRECIQEAHNWVYGDTYFILDRPMLSVIDFLSADVNVRVQWPVKQIEYSPARPARITSTQGNVLFAQRVLLTVPVTVLRDGDINFVPALPADKVWAAHAIGMSNAVKIVCSFSHRVWPEDLFDIVCTDCFVPEMWFTTGPPTVHPTHEPLEPPAAPPPKPLGKFAVVGFAAGPAADSILRLPRDEIIRRMLDQLDAILAAQPRRPFLPWPDTGHQAASPTPDYAVRTCDSTLYPASCAFTGAYIANWANEPFIRGAYSYPTVGAHGARETLAAPVQGRLFFAGEATHPGVNPCLQAAIDTGTRAAAELMAASLSSRL